MATDETHAYAEVRAAALELAPQIIDLIAEAGRRHAACFEEAMRDDLAVEKAAWAEEVEAWKAEHGGPGIKPPQSILPLSGHVDEHAAAAAIATVFLTEDYYRDEVARVLVARASAAGGPRGGSDRRRVVAFLLRVTRQWVERLTSLPNGVAGVEQLHGRALVERERQRLEDS